MQKYSLTLLPILILLQPNTVAAAPITFNTALPVSKGELIFRQQLLYGRASRDNRVRQDLTSVSVTAYGVSPDFTLIGVLPVTTRELDISGNDRTTSGLADARIFGRYTAYQHDFTGGTFRIAPFAGVELPTGRNRDRDELGFLPPSFQTGSGSLDVFGGVVITYATVDFVVDNQLSYQDNSKADDIELGTLYRADTSLQYRIFPSELSAETPGFVYAVLETNLVHQKRTLAGGLSDPNTGGTRLFIAPGLQYATERWIAEAAVQIPVLQDVNGTGLKQDYIVRASFRINF